MSWVIVAPVAAIPPGDHASAEVDGVFVAGDVHADPANAGRGGWTWYTAAAGLMYRVGLESILGLRRRYCRAVFLWRAWVGYRGLHPPAGDDLRRDGHQGHANAGFARGCHATFILCR